MNELLHREFDVPLREDDDALSWIGIREAGVLVHLLHWDMQGRLCDQASSPSGHWGLAAIDRVTGVMVYGESLNMAKFTWQAHEGVLNKLAERWYSTHPHHNKPKTVEFQRVAFPQQTNNECGIVSIFVAQALFQEGAVSSSVLSRISSSSHWTTNQNSYRKQLMFAEIADKFGLVDIKLRRVAEKGSDSNKGELLIRIAGDNVLIKLSLNYSCFRPCKSCCLATRVFGHV